MAAYGALVSVLHTIDQIQLHPHPPISLDKTQVESLTQNITYVQEFLEGHSQVAGYSNEADPLEMRIADAAYAAEDVIESHIVDQILARRYDWENTRSNIDSQVLPRTTTRDKKISFFNFFKCLRSPRKAAADYEDEVSPTAHQFYQSLHKVIENMESLKKEVMEIEERTGARDQLLRNSTPARSLRSSSTGQNVAMVGFDDISVDVMDKLTGGERDRQTISITGMGGSGKTTLATNIYEHLVVVEYFDFRTWVTVSQQYRMRDILLELLQERRQTLSKENEHELGDRLHKKLSGRRYLIIVDDIWDIEVWNQLRRFFPDNKNGSRIVITSRISDFELTSSSIVKMGFLNKDNSWSLFRKIVFGDERCPFELEEIGKKIVNNCRGLPLSIVVVGGLLSKFKHSREYCESIAKKLNLNRVLNSEDDESCLKILHMSYNHLPVYLKPCFLYMGVFPEDNKILVSELIKLWVSEGFLKPVNGRSLEEVADETLQELINRNLVLADELGSTGNIKYCKIHDLLRDLCLREAEKERFYNVIRQHGPKAPEDTSTQRRTVIPENTSQKKIDLALPCESSARSLICDSDGVLPLHNIRLLRIMMCSHPPERDFRKDVFKIVNSRCLVFKNCVGSEFPSSFNLHWNLHTLIIGEVHVDGPFEIWHMPQLRHLKIRRGMDLADIPSSQLILGNLQTLGKVRNLKCCEEMVKRIPNIKVLKVHCTWEIDDYHFNNLSRLHKLESFSCWVFSDGYRAFYLQNLTFPLSLKKLTLSIYNVEWEDKLENIGSLPLLEKLKLERGAFRCGKWETVEGQFPSLKHLELNECSLRYWTTECSHFPRLEHLLLYGLFDLKEIPTEIGEIATLKLIKVFDCNNAVVISAKKIAEEQEELYGEVGFQLQVWERSTPVEETEEYCLKDPSAEEVLP